ncbi:LPS O-antigen chain length determinant protein WzzB [Pseudomonas tussilaginis]|uniref:LPS O-antigen chain length determinant protein WzzB n=1 Tax=unclassified Pseudomonas TaxID=196821 RepID=UPI000C6D304A|nr:MULTISPECIES: Wzz/FepE/Etk N-terminal domain-containing protein [unclassified Pseudomonas]QYX47685.1 LPS O-antigen chain length determinant protein WzzB [Pseudomonas sp. S11A 273]
MRNEPERRSGDDEIDLFELIEGVWRQKVWVLLVAAPIMAIGIAYAVLATPVYEAKLFVQPPSQNDIAQLNYGRGAETGLGTLAVKDVYDVYTKALLSEAVRNKFFRTVYLPTLNDEDRSGSRDALYSEFSKMLNVAQAAKDTPTRYVITANVESPQQAASWVTAYAEMAAERAKQEVLKSNRSEMLVKADNIEQQIAGSKASARKEREDLIAQLKEALVVAKSIGLEKPPLISGTLSIEVSAGMDGSLTYMRGSKALEAEIANLESRYSDDPFITGLRKKQELLTFYRNLKVDPSIIAVYQQDGVVEQPDKPIKPKKLIIVVLSAVAGLALGLVAALGRDVWVRRKRALAST